MERDYFWLSDELFAKFRQLLPTDIPGRPRVEDLRVINCISKSSGAADARSMRLPSMDRRRHLINISNARPPRVCAVAFFMYWLRPGARRPNCSSALRLSGYPAVRLAGVHRSAKRGQYQAIDRSRDGRAAKIHDNEGVIGRRKDCL
ncbi:hypothetical protein [Roseibium sp.]|uniref:hypothetical protein n=1 Tax=Roseibium sp. TaxID=1936156 RepID=UPI003A970197